MPFLLLFHATFRPKFRDDNLLHSFQGMCFKLDPHPSPCFGEPSFVGNRGHEAFRPQKKGFNPVPALPPSYNLTPFYHSSSSSHLISSAGRRRPVADDVVVVGPAAAAGGGGRRRLLAVQHRLDRHHRPPGLDPRVLQLLLGRLSGLPGVGGRPGNSRIGAVGGWERSRKEAGEEIKQLFRVWSSLIGGEEEGSYPVLPPPRPKS